MHLPTHIRWLVVDWTYRLAKTNRQIRELLARYEPSERLIRRIRQCFRLHGDVWPPHRHRERGGKTGPMQLLSEQERKDLVTFVETRADIYQDEICAYIHEYVAGAALLARWCSLLAFAL
jgi:hypothetical protein